MRAIPAISLTRLVSLLFIVAFASLGVHLLTASQAATITIPSGVTLQQVDGGLNYYCGNGFTYACSSSFNGMSWDDPRFFPILDDYSFYPSNSTATFKALGLNTSIRVTSDTDLSLLRNAGIWAIPSPGEGSDIGNETVGFHVEEPSSWSDITDTVQAAGGALNGRLLQISDTWNQFVYGGIGGTPCGTSSMSDTMSCSISTSTGNVHLNLPSADEYWFACSMTSFCQQASGKGIYGLSGNATPDQLARGSNYGDMVDQMRQWVNGNAPVAPYIETEDGLVGSGAREITPPELNWATWDTIVHGARMLIYFGTTSNFGSGSTFGFSQSVLSGQSISMYNQATDTNSLVKDLAPIINSPFALNYASDNKGGYTFPTSHLVLDNGLDVMAKYYTGGSYSNAAGSFNNGFYLFASVRGSESQSNIPVTFTTADKYTGPVSVISAGTGSPTTHTIQSTNGVFSDTFVNSTDTHIYQIPYGNAVAQAPTSPSGSQTGTSTKSTSGASTSSRVPNSAKSPAAASPNTVTGTTNVSSGAVTLLAPNSSVPVSSIAKVDYYIDGKLLASISKAPFTYKLSNKTLTGCHILKVVTYTTAGTTKNQTQQICTNSNQRSSFPYLLTGLSLLAVTVLIEFAPFPPKFKHPIRKGALRLWHKIKPDSTRPKPPVTPSSSGATIITPSS